MNGPQTPVPTVDAHLWPTDDEGVRYHSSRCWCWQERDEADHAASGTVVVPDCGASRHYLDRGNGRPCGTCGQPPFVVAAACHRGDWHSPHHWIATSGDHRYCPGYPL